MPEMWQLAARPGPRCARYMVQLSTVAVFDAGLARRNSGPAGLLPHQPAHQWLRHSVLLGRPHDHDGPETYLRGDPGTAYSVSPPVSAFARAHLRRCEDV